MAIIPKEETFFFFVKDEDSRSLPGARRICRRARRARDIPSKSRVCALLHCLERVTKRIIGGDQKHNREGAVLMPNTRLKKIAKKQNQKARAWPLIATGLVLFTIWRYWVFVPKIFLGGV